MLLGVEVLKRRALDVELPQMTLMARIFVVKKERGVSRASQTTRKSKLVFLKPQINYTYIWKPKKLKIRARDIILRSGCSQVKWVGR